MRHSLTTVLAVTIVCAGALSASADIPERFTYSGYLADDGLPLNAPIDVDFEVYDAAQDGLMVWSHAALYVEVIDGFFTVVLEETEDLAALFDGDDYWMLVIIDELPMYPMTPISSVPFAVRASDSDTVGGMTTTELLEGGALPMGTDISYDNTTSELDGEDVQAALDELMLELDSLRDSIGLLEDLTGLEEAVAQNTQAIEGHDTRVETLDDGDLDHDTRIETLEDGGLDHKLRGSPPPCRVFGDSTSPVASNLMRVGRPGRFAQRRKGAELGQERGPADRPRIAVQKANHVGTKSSPRIWPVLRLCARDRDQ